MGFVPRSCHWLEAWLDDANGQTTDGSLNDQKAQPGFV
jgi:hypothetical protein